MWNICEILGQTCATLSTGLLRDVCISRKAQSPTVAQYLRPPHLSETIPGGARPTNGGVTLQGNKRRAMKITKT